MNSIYIKDGNKKIILYVSDSNIQGYIYEGKNVTKVQEDILEYFKFLKCSSNKTVLEDENVYSVVLDNDTNFKHYYKDGIEDYEMFLQANGKPCIEYEIKELDPNKIKKSNNYFALIVGVAIITVSSIGAQAVSNILYLNELQKTSAPYEQEQNIDYLSGSDIAELLNESSLSDKDKQTLQNSKFFEDISNVVNNDPFSLNALNHKLKNLKVEFFPYEQYLGHDGYYTDNTIHISDNTLYEYDDILTHEFMHACQSPFSNKYKMITEACAEILSYEYYDSPVDSYPRQVRTIRKLMEIIGSKPIFNYVLTEDFSNIEDMVKPNLSEEEYTDFLECLNFDSDDKPDLDNKIKRLNEIIDTLYYNIYHEDVNDNEVIKLIEKCSSLKRYYFNDDYINEDNSYYIEYSWENINIEDAIRNGIVTIYEYTDELDKEEAYSYFKEGKEPVIVPKFSESFIFDKAEYDRENILFYGTLNGKELKEKTEEQLKELGVLEYIHYYNPDSLIPVDPDKYLEEIVHEKTGNYMVIWPKGGTMISKDILMYAKEDKIYVPPFNPEKDNLNRKTP